MVLSGLAGRPECCRPVGTVGVSLVQEMVLPGWAGRPECCRPVGTDWMALKTRNDGTLKGKVGVLGTGGLEARRHMGFAD